jgi:hypothetical protein
MFDVGADTATSPASTSTVEREHLDTIPRFPLAITTSSTPRRVLESSPASARRAWPNHQRRLPTRASTSPTLLSSRHRRIDLQMAPRSVWSDYVSVTRLHEIDAREIKGLKTDTFPASPGPMSFGHLPASATTATSTTSTPPSSTGPSHSPKTHRSPTLRR